MMSMENSYSSKVPEGNSRVHSAVSVDDVLQQDFTDGFRSFTAELLDRVGLEIDREHRKQVMRLLAAGGQPLLEEVCSANLESWDSVPDLALRRLWRRQSTQAGSVSHQASSRRVSVESMLPVLNENRLSSRQRPLTTLRVGSKLSAQPVDAANSNGTDSDQVLPIGSNSASSLEKQLLRQGIGGGSRHVSKGQPQRPRSKSPTKARSKSPTKGPAATGASGRAAASADEAASPKKWPPPTGGFGEAASPKKWPPPTGGFGEAASGEEALEALIQELPHCPSQTFEPPSGDVPVGEHSPSRLGVAEEMKDRASHTSTNSLVESYHSVKPLPKDAPERLSNGSVKRVQVISDSEGSHGEQTKRDSECRAKVSNPKRALGSGELSKHMIGKVSLCLSKEEAEGDESDNESGDAPMFVLLRDWHEQRAQKSFASSITRGTLAQSTRDCYAANDINSGEDSKLSWIDANFSRLIVNPTSKRRIAWDIFSCLLVCYEAVVLPLLLLEVNLTRNYNIVAWLLRAFWTFDMMWAFCVSYTNDEATGNQEKRLTKCAFRYFRTWFPIDLLTVSVDWADVFTNMNAEGASAARLSKIIKVFRIARILRVSRLIRVRGLQETIQSFSEFYTKLSAIVVIFGVLKILVALVWINHVFACGLFALGKGDLFASKEETTWLIEYGLEEMPMSHVYWIAFHWALTQFTGAMEVVPKNSTERIYSIVVLLFAFAASASIVGSLTTAMTRFESLRSPDEVQLSRLKNYLFDNKVSNKLALRIYRNAQFALDQLRKHTPENDVRALSLISASLKVELHYEQNMPTLEVHPLFRRLAEVNYRLMGRVCHTSLSRLLLSRTDILFNVGEMAASPAMYFLLSGRMHYIHHDGAHAVMQPKQWASEAAMWVSWAHRGTLTARMDSNLLVILASQFAKIAAEFPIEMIHIKDYAKEYLFCLNASAVNKLTDLQDPDINLRRLARWAFRPGENHVPGTYNMAGAMSSISSRGRNSQASDEVRPLPSGTYSIFSHLPFFLRRRSNGDREMESEDSDQSEKKSQTTGITGRLFSKTLGVVPSTASARGREDELVCGAWVSGATSTFEAGHSTSVQYIGDPERALSELE